MRFFCNACQTWVEDGDDPLTHMTTEHAEEAYGDKYRYCIYCGADCWLERENQEHRPDCPAVTGLFLIREEDLYGPSPEGGERVFHGMRCMDCEKEFEVGDVYMHREIDSKTLMIPGSGSRDQDVFEIICVGCAARVQPSEA